MESVNASYILVSDISERLDSMIVRKSLGLPDLIKLGTEESGINDFRGAVSCR